jgi:hypothetical protein
MGPFRDTSFLGKGIINFAFPGLLAIMACMTIFGVYAKILHWVGLEQFQFGSNISKDIVSEGQMIMT